MLELHALDGARRDAQVLEAERAVARVAQQVHLRELHGVDGEQRRGREERQRHRARGRLARQRRRLRREVGHEHRRRLLPQRGAHQLHQLAHAERRGPRQRVAGRGGGVGRRLGLEQQLPVGGGHVLHGDGLQARGAAVDEGHRAGEALDEVLDGVEEAVLRAHHRR
eukprot:scaffold1834_cov331-Prasinococcus_capsulatus_cf.AAC.11